ncbi:MAG: tetratricopeptide repeat protein [Bacteroidales bacterium]|jgi:tetratricopeptide (TPR) repeat protein|nr:tetratricopeptide repeat protein [Bacteroidales bacterium]
MTGMTTIYRTLVAGILMMTVSGSLSGQQEREFIRKGNRLYKKGEYAGSEGMYRRVQDNTESAQDAVFNLGDALYRQQRYSEAATEFNRSVLASEGDSLMQAEGFYNLGNSLLKEEKFRESINAYINSLRLNPDNMEAKYNLAYAQDQLKKQEEQQQQQNQDKDQQQDQKKEDDQKQNDQERKDDPQQQEDQNKDQQQQQQQASISREDARRLLDALAANEKKAQEKVQRDKAAKAKVRVIKNW